MRTNGRKNGYLMKLKSKKCEPFDLLVRRSLGEDGYIEKYANGLKKGK